MTDPAVVSPAPRRPQHQVFEFTGTELEGRHLRLRYALRGGPDEDVSFEESLWLPDELPAPDPTDPVVARLIDGCHRVFGVSYFKSAIPPTIETSPVLREDAAFWDCLYSVGMGEFYFRNGLDPRDRTAFPRLPIDPQADSLRRHQASFDGTMPERALVLIGGGKDSAVVAEVVRHAAVPAVALSLGESRWIRASASAAGLEHVVIRRRLDPKLFELNTRGAWNGHIPISACIAFVSALVAYAGGFTDVIVGNERAADEGNVEWKGITINHQWSKTLVFERAFQQWLDRHLHGSPRYFSLVRPLSEVAIAAAFVKRPSHFESFTSCNANFRQPGAAEAERWCGRCPKCVFVELMLSPHVDDDGLRRIFPRSFLADAANIPLLEELAGMSGIKPWECVGTPDECRLSLTLLHEQGRLRGAAAAWVAANPQVLLVDSARQLASALAPSGPHMLSPIWEERLRAYLGPSA
jgi:UDP-N-acetyl-alpha-D-muramoyl-L-alanyl-L-glutamate epimerase